MFADFLPLSRSVCVFTRDEETAIVTLNPHVKEMPSDILYHLALGSGSHDLHAMFGDVKVSRVGYHRPHTGHVMTIK